MDWLNQPDDSMVTPNDVCFIKLCNVRLCEKHLGSCTIRMCASKWCFIDDVVPTP